MPSEHREAIQQTRIESARALQLHRQILTRQREINHRQLTIARLALDAQRPRTLRESAKAEAREYKVVWLRAKKNGAQLLQFVDRHFKKVA